MKKQRIVPQIWFGTGAKEAAELYTKAFPDSDIVSVIKLPSVKTEQVTFKIRGYEFLGLETTGNMDINPSISFMVHFKPGEEAMLEETWKVLMNGGHALMPLDKYPFSQKFGWVQDKFGVTWQLFQMDKEVPGRDLVLPALLFTGDVLARAEEAMNEYHDVFRDSRTPEIHYYPEGAAPNETNHVMHGEVILENYLMSAQDSALSHNFQFNEGISLVIYCDTQEEVDYYSEKLSAEPKEEVCGWLKDKFGVSWNVVPRALNEMYMNGNPEQVKAVADAMIKMKRLDIEGLEAAFNRKI